MDIDPDANILILQTRIHGVDKTARLLMALDTRATFTTIPSDIARKLGYDPSRPEKWGTVTGISGQERMPLLRIGSIEVMEQKVEDCWVGIHDLPREARVDGLLGLSYIKHTRLLLDMRSKLLEITDTRA